MIAARLSPGVISESNSSHLLSVVGSNAAKPVMFLLAACRTETHGTKRLCKFIYFNVLT
jgi:hypothetical protein